MFRPTLGAATTDTKTGLPDDFEMLANLRATHGNHTMSKLIALDADGVLLDYSAAYAGAWERAFGSKPALQNPNAYWPTDRWGVPRLVGRDLDALRAAFDDHFWSTIPAVEGALRGCQMLEEAGYELICVTALDPRNHAARERNLRELGFPIKQVIATDNEGRDSSPKAAVLNSLNVAAFVDDYGPYLKGVASTIHRALILRDPDGSPNLADGVSHADSTHRNLLEFSRWWANARDALDP